MYFTNSLFIMLLLRILCVFQTLFTFLLILVLPAFWSCHAIAFFPAGKIHHDVCDLESWLLEISLK